MKIELTNYEARIILRALSHLEMQCDEADDEELGYFLEDPQDRHNASHTCSFLQTMLRTNLATSEHRHDWKCSLCGIKAEELTQRCDMTLGSTEPVWLCDSCDDKFSEDN
jgi:hypothetical protein